MEHRNVHAFAQGLFDDEAFGGLDVLQIDAAKGRLEQLDAFDEALHVLGLHLDVDRIDVGEAFEQHRLALHHRLGGERAEIAEAENGGAVRDHRDQIALGGIVIGGRRIGRDRAHRHRDAGRIGKRQIALGRHRLGGDDLDLAGPPFGMEQQCLAFGKLDVRFVGHGRSPCRRPQALGAGRAFVTTAMTLRRLAAKTVHATAIPRKSITEMGSHCFVPCPTRARRELRGCVPCVIPAQRQSGETRWTPKRAAR